MVSFLDMPVSSAAPIGTPEGYSMKIDGNNLFTLYSESDGSGGIQNSGVGIGTTNPETKLDVSGTFRNTLATTHSLLGGSGNIFVMADDTGTLYATSSPSILGDYLPLTGGTMSGDINMGGNDITNVNKLTVITVDPLYKIKGINYSTYAPSVVGGVKEEYVGKVAINEKNQYGGYEEIIDFTKQKEGSDLWVWHQTVDFNYNNVEVLITPYGGFAQTYYQIEDDRIIFRSDRPITISYRLVGHRIDWRNWPTKAVDQTEQPGLIIN